MNGKQWDWLKKLLRPFSIILAVLVGVILLLVLIRLGYNADWTGFNEVKTATPPQSQEAKTLWDWMQLLIVPIVLAVGAILFNLATSRTDQKIAQQRYESDQKIALDKQKEDLLQAYLDRMSELLLKENLRNSAPNTEVRNVAKTRTVTVLCQLNSERKNYVLSFLREANLVSSEKDKSVVTFRFTNFIGTDFSNTDLRLVDLREANLSSSNLSSSNLRGANLRGANLRGANLRGANLSSTNLRGADLRGADLSRADLRDANFIFANLNNANINNANLSSANFIFADLSGADLSGADLSSAHLSSANLSGANLSGANLNEANLIEANFTFANLSGANLNNANLLQDDLNKLHLTEDQVKVIQIIS